MILLKAGKEDGARPSKYALYTPIDDVFGNFNADKILYYTITASRAQNRL